MVKLRRFANFASMYASLCPECLWVWDAKGYALDIFPFLTLAVTVCNPDFVRITF